MAVVAVAPCQCFSPGGEPNQVPRADFLNGTLLPLHPADARGDNQGPDYIILLPSKRAREDNKLARNYVETGRFDLVNIVIVVVIETKAKVVSNHRCYPCSGRKASYGSLDATASNSVYEHFSFTP